ncbi:MAG: Crossover junction endodeoxyribonuclease RuvC [Chlamydiae bacterium]|nr:Crossover junction endodeoxyribonuclease RuvC [Chlamydiota bacterium]
MGNQEKKGVVVLGVDPGTIITGYGVIHHEGSRFKALDYGCIKPPTSKKLSDRYWIIFSALLDLLEKYTPDMVVVETQYVNKNVSSAMKLGMARGGVIIAAKKYGLPIYEYAPTKAKLAVTGNGLASKVQVQAMVQKLLNLSQIPQPEDAADALALAICHLHNNQTEGSEI